MNASIDWALAEMKAGELLGEYIRINTVNPPGNETAGVNFLRYHLLQYGFKSQIFEAEEGRGNLISVWKGKGTKPPLLLLNHIDVVPVEEEKWDNPPFCGKDINGTIWGRGSLDCKSLGITQLTVLSLLKESGFIPDRDIIFASTADEEAGSSKGIGWLIENHFDILSAGFVINEGGGCGVTLNGKNLYMCQIGEKGVLWIKIIFFGEAGHASIPVEKNCITEMSKTLAAIDGYSPPLKKTEITLKFIESLKTADNLKGSIDKILIPETHKSGLEEIKDNGLRNIIKAMLHNTFVPTVVAGGEKTNVIPGECSCEVDCRIVPGDTPKQIIKELRDLIPKRCDYKIEIITESDPTFSSTDTELYKLMEKSLLKHDPKAEMVPTISSGATDSRFFRQKGAHAYGFFPIQVGTSMNDYIQGIHGHNERISFSNLSFAIRVLFDTVREFCV
ncbi:MAG: M20/M25/M40 family metallo-hydrolase [Thermodesulfobacteriota bacterium]|nr:M20/M25/M40 family metallo-hydrolase [Thermodesulfobacteriota bacterium]